MGILHHGSRGQCSLPRGLWLCLHSLETTFTLQLQESCFKVNSDPMGPMTNLSLTESQILMFKVSIKLSISIYPCGLSVSSLSILLPQTHSTPVTPGPVSCSITPGMFFGASPQGLLITEHFPGLKCTPLLSPSISFFTTLTMTPWHRISLSLLCVSSQKWYYFTICIYHSCFLCKKTMLSEEKGYQ